MPTIAYREADLADVSALARIRTAEWGTEQYWQDRIGGYMRGEVHPQQSLLPRIVLVAAEEMMLVGFIAGHLTRRSEGTRLNSSHTVISYAVFCLKKKTW